MSALMDAMKATQFGRPFDRKPIKFEGYYKFTPGKDFQDENGNIVQGKEDICNIYAVIYKTMMNMEILLFFTVMMSRPANSLLA